MTFVTPFATGLIPSTIESETKILDSEVRSLCIFASNLTNFKTRNVQNCLWISDQVNRINTLILQMINNPIYSRFGKGPVEIARQLKDLSERFAIGLPIAVDSVGLDSRLRFVFSHLPQTSNYITLDLFLDLKSVVEIADAETLTLFIIRNRLNVNCMAPLNLQTATPVYMMELLLPLICAVQDKEKALNVLDVLLRAGLNLNPTDKNGFVPLNIICRHIVGHNKEDLLKKLLNAGAIPSGTVTQPLALEVVQLPESTLSVQKHLSLLISYGVDLNVEITNTNKKSVLTKFTPLLKASLTKRIDIVEAAIYSSPEQNIVTVIHLFKTVALKYMNEKEAASTEKALFSALELKKCVLEEYSKENLVPKDYFTKSSVISVLRRTKCIGFMHSFIHEMIMDMYSTPFEEIAALCFQRISQELRHEKSVNRRS